ncbi:protein spinster-like isoform X2 [Tigriopus californicus]|uniref:protein spinster-like isoform X2 n=1 Tax=Tigriopus californicus TaxID=6832 RepID=UPI0027DA2B08|nr:protein spinster-like isoform X2 [Tigriopus californicus]
MPAQTLKESPVKAAVVTFPYNPSSQRLMAELGEKEGGGASEVNLLGRLYEPEGSPNRGMGGALSGYPKTPNHISRRQWITVIILFFVNLINYMDRLTIAGILTKIQNDYQIGDAEGGALQTAFVISYMIFAPIFGYMGDRHSRKLIMGFGVFLWTIFTLIGSFMPNYHLFLLCRAMVGIGEASYSTIAPTVISDMFVKDIRSKMLAFFYFAIPVGSGLGYVVGSETTMLAGGDWRWGLRVTPILGVIATFLIIFCMNDPPRGESEGHGNLKATTYAKDLQSLAKNKSFMLSTVAFTCVAFCTGALSWWGPKYIEYAVALAQAQNNTDVGSINVRNVSLIFGVVTMLSGIVGVPLGSILSTKLKQKYPRADPLICACGLLISALFLSIGMITASWNIYVTFALLFVGEVALNLNWSIVADILLYVVVPTRRSTAEAVQILVSHAFGDAGSPYLIGLMSDALKQSLSQESVCLPESASKSMPAFAGLESYSNVTQCDVAVDYYGMQYSLFTNSIVEVIGGIFFIITAIYIIRDKRKCDRFIAGESPSISTDDEDEDLPPQLQLILPNERA